MQVSIADNFVTSIVDEVVNTTTKAISGLSHSTKYYWRVQAINAENTSEWSEVWSFTTEAPASVSDFANSISISPQPVLNEAIITLNDVQANSLISIELYDIKGTIVGTYDFTSSSEVTNTLRLDASNIPAGMYNALIKNGAKVYKAKFVKVD